MKEYFASVMALTFIGGIVVSLSPKGAAQRYLRLLVALAVTGCIITPIFSFLGDAELDGEALGALFEYESDERDYEEIYNNSIILASVDECQRDLENEILQALSGDIGDIDVVISASEKSGEIYIERAEVHIYPSGLSLDPHFMKEQVSERLRCDCEVIYVSE